MPATKFLSVHAAKDIFNLDATLDQFFRGGPSPAVFFSLGNYLFKRALSFRFRFVRLEPFGLFSASLDQESLVCFFAHCL